MFVQETMKILVKTRLHLSQTSLKNHHPASPPIASVTDRDDYARIRMCYIRVSTARRDDRVADKPAESQIATMIELLLRSGLPPTYQEHLLDAAPSLTTEQVAEVTTILTAVLSAEQSYIDATHVWRQAWEEIAKKIDLAVGAALQEVEDELFAEITGSSPATKKRPD